MQKAWHSSEADRARTATAAASAMAVLPAPVGAHTSTELPARNFSTAFFWKPSRGNWKVSSISSRVKLLLADRMSASICRPATCYGRGREDYGVRRHTGTLWVYRQHVQASLLCQSCKCVILQCCDYSCVHPCSDASLHVPRQICCLLAAAFRTVCQVDAAFAQQLCQVAEATDMHRVYKQQ